MNCEMCGKEGPVVQAMVEGTQLSLCTRCAGHGKVLSPPPRSIAVKSRPAAPRAPTPTETIVPEYAARIHKAREKLGLTQKEFAARLNEKESILQKLENGTYEPPIELARKLERLLSITLVEISEEQKVSTTHKSGSGMTIGDILKL